MTQGTQSLSSVTTSRDGVGGRGLPEGGHVDACGRLMLMYGGGHPSIVIILQLKLVN